MTSDQLDAALRGYARRRPFRPFLLEFFSGTQVLVPHPEAIDFQARLYLLRRPDGGYLTFASESVCCLVDQSMGPAK